MKHAKHKKRNIVLLLLLAVLCIAGAELAACRHFDPEHYEQITAPVRRGLESAAAFCRNTCDSASAFCRDTLDSAARFWEDLTTREEEDLVDPENLQIASEPTLIDSTPVTDPLITELREVDGQETLTGGTISIVYFNQGDDAWADLPYGSDDIGRYGCGPTAMAMAIASMTGEDTDPATMAQWAADHGYWARRSGSYLSIVEGTAAAYGLQAESVTGRTPDELISELVSGKILVALMGPGHFTQGGHFILLRGVTLSGMILVADPNSTERSLTVWDPQLILDELSTHTSSGGPLWAISWGEMSLSPLDP